jgi:hypothetical protein
MTLFQYREDNSVNEQDLLVGWGEGWRGVRRSQEFGAEAWRRVETGKTAGKPWSKFCFTVRNVLLKMKPTSLVHFLA